MSKIGNKKLYNPPGDGNCSLNSFGIGLLDLYLQGAFHDEGRALALQNLLHTYLRKNSFKELLEETKNIKTIELTLARALREYLVALFEEDFPAESLDNMILAAFVDYVARRKRLNSSESGFSGEDIISRINGFEQHFAKIYQQHQASFKNADSVFAVQNQLDLKWPFFAELLGGKGVGKKLYLDYLRSSGKWLGDLELGRLAKDFKIGFVVHRLNYEPWGLTSDGLVDAPRIDLRNDRGIHWKVYLSKALKAYFPTIIFERDTEQNESAPDSADLKKSNFYTEAEARLKSVTLDVQSAFAQLSAIADIQNFLAEGCHKDLQEAFDALLALTLDEFYSKEGNKKSERQAFEYAFRRTHSLVSTLFAPQRKIINQQVGCKDFTTEVPIPRAISACW